MSEAYSTLYEISKRFDKEDFELLANHPQFCFTINNIELFTNHIFKRVKRQNPNRIVKQEFSRIVIQSKDKAESLHLYPMWKHIGECVECEVSREINQAIRRIERLECQHIYLLFPRNANFRKHVPIRSPKLDQMGLEYTLKLVPYTIY